MWLELTETSRNFQKFASAVLRAQEVTLRSLCNNFRLFKSKYRVNLQCQVNAVDVSSNEHLDEID